MDPNKINSEVTKGNFGLEKVLKELAGGLGGVFENGLTSGNVYFVMKTDETWHAAFVNKYQRIYSDGTYAVQPDIQAGLDAVTANRDDYVIVMPSSSDYDITATLTMSKGRTHLIAPAGLGKMGMQSNAVRVHQETAATAVFTISADTVEVAGFFLKCSTGNGFTLTSTRWHADIHDNFVGMANTDGTDSHGIIGAGACYHMGIWNNYLVNYSPGAVSGTDNDLASFITFSSSSSGRSVIRNNIIQSGVNTEVTSAMNIQGDASMVIDNIVMETQAIGAAETGILTAGITASAGTALIRNVSPGLAASAFIVGPTVDLMCVENYSGLNGGTVVDTDT